MSRHSLRWLSAQAREATRVIEVGCWLGRATQALARSTTGTVWAVDHWRGVPGDPGQHDRLYATALLQGDVFARFCDNLAPEIASGRVVPVRCDSVTAARNLFDAHGATFDFVFIDADHGYEAVAADIDAYLPLVRPGGIVAGHDYADNWPGVMRAVDERFSDRALAPGTIWWTRV